MPAARASASKRCLSQGGVSVDPRLPRGRSGQIDVVAGRAARAPRRPRALARRPLVAVDGRPCTLFVRASCATLRTLALKHHPCARSWGRRRAATPCCDAVLLRATRAVTRRVHGRSALQVAPEELVARARARHALWRSLCKGDLLGVRAAPHAARTPTAPCAERYFFYAPAAPGTLRPRRAARRRAPTKARAPGAAMRLFLRFRTPRYIRTQLARAAGARGALAAPGGAS